MAKDPEWALELAKTIALDLCALRTNKESIGLVAARLQKLRLEGERDGIAIGRDAVMDALALHDDAAEPQIEVLPIAAEGLDA